MDNHDLLLLYCTITHHQTKTYNKAEILDYTHFLTVVLIVGSNEDHAWLVENRYPHRQYLGWMSLLPNPCIGTPWIHLYDCHEDCAFITTMGVDTSMFHALLAAGFGHLWYTWPITRPDHQTVVQPQVGKRSLDAVGRLRLVLHWLSSTMQQVSLQQIFALISSTMSRYLHFALSILLEVLRQMPPVTITWPQGDKFLKLSGYVSMQHPLLHGVFGSIDGLNLPCQVSSDIEMENAMYMAGFTAILLAQLLCSTQEVHVRYPRQCSFPLGTHNPYRRNSGLLHKLPRELAQFPHCRGNLRQAGTRYAGWVQDYHRHCLSHGSQLDHRENPCPAQSQ